MKLASGLKEIAFIAASMTAPFLVLFMYESIKLAVGSSRVYWYLGEMVEGFLLGEFFLILLAFFYWILIKIFYRREILSRKKLRLSLAAFAVAAGACTILIFNFDFVFDSNLVHIPEWVVLLPTIVGSSIFVYCARRGDKAATSLLK